MRKKTQYGGDVVMFLLNKIIKNVGLAHGFKTINDVFLKPSTICMVLKPCAHGFYAHGCKTMHIHNKCWPKKNVSQKKT